MAGKQTWALITGASRGIGKHITQKLLDNDFKVTGTHNQSAFPKAFQKNPNFESLEVNLNHHSQLKEVAQPLFSRLTSPTILINNAGISEAADFDENDDSWLQTWDKTQQVNMRAPAILCKWAINRWQKDAGGIIINVSSRAAYRGDTKEFTAYAASKGALVSFTKSIARGYGKQGIVAYSIAPGFIKTDMAMDAVDVYGESYLTQGTAFDEITSPVQVAELVAFLSTGNVPHMTGATFHINAGSYMI